MSNTAKHYKSTNKFNSFLFDYQLTAALATRQFTQRFNSVS